jgi:DNA-directed RNA polymerase subunit K/omega
MSDTEEPTSDNYSDSESENETQRKTNFKLGGNDKSIKTLVSPNIDDDYDSDSDVSIEDAEDVEELEDDQIGGVADFDSDQDKEEDDETDADEEHENDDDDEGEKQQTTASKKIKVNKVKKPVQINLQDDDDDEDDDDDLYLQKFDNEITKNYINEFHPECLIHNYDEIAKLTIVVRDSNNIIIDPLHKTIPFLTKYERARILGQRAKQIETGARPFVNVPENVIDSYVIAELELQQKRIPFIIRRPIPGGACEYWNLKDLEVISF